ncbi:hypothetical protein ACHAW6_006658 [Cyclotella cf. meneghiniana]
MCAVTASSQKDFRYKPIRPTDHTVHFAMRPQKVEPATVIVGTPYSSSLSGMSAFVLSGRRGQSVNHCCTQPSSTHCLAMHPSLCQETRASSVVPIPVGKDRRQSVPNREETSDLTRMYDSATWKMYERIVNARRRRQCFLDAHRTLQQDNECDIKISSHADDPLSKSDLQVEYSNDSLMADESDESSVFYLASLSSTYATQSTPFPSGAVFKDVPSECYQEEQKVLVQEEQKVLVLEEGENEEYFIFEIDL